MRSKRVLTLALTTVTLVWLVTPLGVRADCGWCERRRPYGDYCGGGRSARYGANDPVKTESEARTRLKLYFEDENVVVGKIAERDSYFEADIRDADGDLVDRVIIDKRTGRIRSIL